MGVIIRDAVAADVDAICALAIDNKAFEVSQRILFYEREELLEWVERPQDNLLCVVEVDGRVRGFFFCKVMSWHWALLDTFYCQPVHCHASVGATMLGVLIERLRQRGVAYLTTLIESDRKSLGRLLVRGGFGRSKSYDWYEMFLDQ